MKYTINILKESKVDFIMELLSSFDFIQIEEQPKADDDQDWWDDLTPKHQQELTAKLEAIENGTAELVSDEEVRRKAQELINSKKEQKF